MCMLLGMSKQLVYTFPGFYNKETIYSNIEKWILLNPIRLKKKHPNGCKMLYFFIYFVVGTKSILGGNQSKVL